MGEVERYRPLPERRGGGGPARPPRLVLLYLDEDGGRMSGWEWVKPEVVFEVNHEYDVVSPEPLKPPFLVGTTSVVTISGSFRGLEYRTKEEEQG